MRAFSSCSEWGYSLLQCTSFSLRWLPLLRSTGSRGAGFSSCGTWAQLLRGMWDLPRPGIEPMSPALAGGFQSTVPPGKLSASFLKVTFSSVQFSSLSHVWLFVTPWTAACQASLTITNSQSLLKLMSSSQWCHPTISSPVVPFSSCRQSFPAAGSFPMSPFFASGGQSIGASAPVLPMNIQDWFPLGLISWISLQSKGLKSLLQHHSSKVSLLAFSFLSSSTLTFIHDYWKHHSFD